MFLLPGNSILWIDIANSRFDNFAGVGRTVENPVDQIWRGEEKSAADWLTDIHFGNKRREGVGD